MQRHVRISLVDGRTLLIGFRALELRDAHNRDPEPLTLAEATALLSAQPEPQRSSGLDVLARHHQAAGG